MLADEIVVKVVEGDGVLVVFQFLAEGVGKAGEAPDAHANGWILPLDVARADMEVFRMARTTFLAAAGANGRAVPRFAGPLRAVELYKLGVINVAAERRFDRFDVELQAVAGKLDARVDPIRDVVHEGPCVTGFAQANQVADAQFRVGVDGRPRPDASDPAAAQLPCFVLAPDERPKFVHLNALRLKRADGQVVVLRCQCPGITGGGGLEKYLGVSAYKAFVDNDLFLERLVSFRLPEVEGLEREVKGLRSDALIEVCRGLMAALSAHFRGEHRLTDRQQQIAFRAAQFMSACAKTGLDALIDEATGYQYDRPYDALQVKLRAYLSEELRPWEKTFPDELWHHFARLTNWTGSVTKRPKYWGRLVNELVYEYLDADVARWLKENAPKPQKGQNYHSWLSAQYGLQKLLEHIWKLIGIAGTCTTMVELRQKMAEMHGKALIQFTLPFDQTWR